MLQLQRASAGSGKTYTLARKYIWYLITAPLPGGGRRLRHPRETAEALRSILAVTFTNKATNEMKSRIVARLSDLSEAGETGDAPYMEEFMSELGVTAKEISDTCRGALTAVLNHYSDFNISTIDSFFQRVLRTFAYETDLNDNYQLELDSTYVASVGLDSMLEQFDASDTVNRETRFWLQTLIEQDYLGKGKAQWNPFARSRGRFSLYTELAKSVKCLEKENFKEIKSELDEYLASAPDLRHIYRRCEEMYRDRTRELTERCRGAASRFLTHMEEQGVEDLLKSYLVKNFRKLVADPEADLREIKIAQYADIHKKASNKAQRARIDEALPGLQSAFDEALGAQQELLDDQRLTHWSVYRKTFPYLGLVQQIRLQIRDYLQENNVVELSETNSILRRIIADEDAPFIYERLGTRLNHYLIDEFQDTSRLQWENMRPLLSESIANGHENLIIGDAKQSIYRFRNADPTLITGTVQRTFGEECIPCGTSREENTNWRSERHIVEFNNFVFRSLSDRLTTERGGGLDFSAVYCNTAQYPRHREEQGYVEVNFPFAEFTDTAGGASEEEKGMVTAYYRGFGHLVKELLGRGYRQKDIAFLVWRNDDGIDLINGLISFNESLPENEELIQFVSEQSLLVSNSEGVATVISVLEAINAGSHIELRTGDEARKKGVADWRDISCNFNFFVRRHPDMPRAEQITEFLRHPDTEDSLSIMLRDMQTVALPALVEAIILTFVDENTRRNEAAFLAAFQDLAVDFCEGPSTDIAAFLKWWQEKGVAKSITSPEEMDAVRVMTVHKSKGLEFPVVILPRADVKFTPKAGEWSWVTPYPVTEGMPPYLPVKTDQALSATRHGDLFTESADLDILDKLNSVYVAFTRAAAELRVYVPGKDKKENNSLRDALFDILEHHDNLLGEGCDGAEFMTCCNDITHNPELRQFTLGTPAPYPGYAEDSDTSADSIRLISEYRVTPARTLLAYHGKHDPNPAVMESLFGGKGDEDETGDDPELVALELLEETDPRAVGTLLHGVLEQTETIGDLGRAVRQLRLNGEVTPSDAENMEKMLRDAIGDSELTRGWFDGTKRVMTERSLLSRNMPVMRPDRIMINEDGTATVVDYKFGSAALVKRHVRQVRRYMKMLGDTGLFPEVKGYVWYIREKRTVPVD